MSRHRSLFFVLTAIVMTGCAESAANEATHARYEEGMALLTAGGEANVGQAIERFREVLAEDSLNVGAWTGLSRAYWGIGSSSATLPPERTRVQARDAAEHAVAAGPADVEAHVALGNAKAADWDWVGADAEFGRALEIDPASLRAMRARVTLLYGTGRVDEAAALLQRTIAAEPEGGEMFLRYLITGDEETSLRVVSERMAAAGASPAINDFWTLARIHAREGRWQEAIQQLELQMPLMNGDVADETAMRGYALGRMGRAADARASLVRLDSMTAAGRYVSPVHRAWVHLGLGESARALDLLTEAVDTHQHRTGLDFVALRFPLEPVASSPRFAALLTKMGLAP